MIKTQWVLLNPGQHYNGHRINRAHESGGGCNVQVQADRRQLQGPFVRSDGSKAWLAALVCFSKRAALRHAFCCQIDCFVLSGSDHCRLLFVGQISCSSGRLLYPACIGRTISTSVGFSPFTVGSPTLPRKSLHFPKAVTRPYVRTLGKQMKEKSLKMA